jgi:RNA polymerase sigma factor (sigma-70 family)
VNSNALPYREEDLLERLQCRDRKAFEDLYDRYSAALFGVISRILRDQALSEDVLQETFVKVWKKIHTYDPARGRFFTWMLNIARNLSIDKLRSKEIKYAASRTELDLTDFDRSGPSETMQVDHIGLKEMVGRLPEGQKEAIMLVYFGGYTHKEAAEHLGLKLGTLKSRVRLAMKRLREFMQ